MVSNEKGLQSILIPGKPYRILNGKGISQLAPCRISELFERTWALHFLSAAVVQIYSASCQDYLHPILINWIEYFIIHVSIFLISEEMIRATKGLICNFKWSYNYSLQDLLYFQELLDTQNPCSFLMLWNPVCYIQIMARIQKNNSTQILIHLIKLFNREIKWLSL